MKEYDYIIVGAGIYGATVAERLANKWKSVLVIDKREHLAGNIYSYTDKETGIEIHKYGSHIFHTEDEEVWEYITHFTNFNNYTHTVKTRHNGRLYPMPINLDTINLLYGTNMDAEEAEEFVKKEAAKENIGQPKNFEEKGLSLVGRKLYEAFLKNYTAKQWATEPTNLSVALLSRIPVRFSHDDRYFMTARHQGIPTEGYTKMIEKMLDNSLIDMRLKTDFNDIKNEIPSDSHIVYCGQIDELMDFQFGDLPYRSLRFEQETANDTLGQAVINEADIEVPYTRSHDYKYYQCHQPEIVSQEKSIICREYPDNYEREKEAYYPVNNPESAELYAKYKQAALEKYPNMILGGRLGAYQYWDMDKAIRGALDLVERLT